MKRRLQESAGLDFVAEKLFEKSIKAPKWRNEIACGKATEER
jgi:hypothetical protein